MNIQGTLIGGLAIAGLSAFAASQVQRHFDQAACEGSMKKIREASVVVINAKLQEILTLTAERDQAKAEVDKVNATTAAQFAALQTMLADDKVKREEASLRIEAAAREASKNAKTAGDRAQAIREIVDKVADRCAGADIPDDLKRMLDGILEPGTASASLGGGPMPPAKGRDR